ncbi:hypothetical protein OF122_16430 [Pelagibacterium flavum]|uniref:Uncharacterized protein n=1 Tax=Pelagibacterium flavum TaxID=2984530 RepID=A0ABY6IML2_9HYPH|nr:hypothetical protein [Pelagibacterium sp. YIM 151497]UYQ71609.1 hypothetical protein OF122_16430 [Pelagibacterium sp. YIM 151497]
MKESQNDEQRFQETLKRMLKTPPKPHKPKEDGPARKPDQKEEKPE